MDVDGFLRFPSGGSMHSGRRSAFAHYSLSFPLRLSRPLHFLEFLSIHFMPGSSSRPSRQPLSSLPRCHSVSPATLAYALSDTLTSPAQPWSISGPG